MAKRYNLYFSSLVKNIPTTASINVTDLLFPILDIVRLAVRHENICSVLATPEFVQGLIESCSYSAANQLMTARCFVNMLNHGVGKSLVQNRFLDIVRELCKIKQGSGNLQVRLVFCSTRKTLSNRPPIRLITDCHFIVLLERNNSTN